MNFVSTTCNTHLAKMEFLENKHHMQAFLTLAESKVKSWIIKYGRHESVELILQNYIVSPDLDFFSLFFQKIWIKRHNTVIESINVWLTLFLHHCHFYLSHLLSGNFSLKNMSHCSSPWNSLLMPWSMLTAQVSWAFCTLLCFILTVKKNKTVKLKKHFIMYTATR